MPTARSHENTRSQRVDPLLFGLFGWKLAAIYLGIGLGIAILCCWIIGVPMYSNAAGIIPIVQALLGKGAALGTVLAFMMSVIELSLPEAVILRKVLKARLIAVFFGVVAMGVILIGFPSDADLEQMLQA